MLAGKIFFCISRNTRVDTMAKRSNTTAPPCFAISHLPPLLPETDMRR